MNKKLIIPGLFLLIMIVVTVTILLFTGPRMRYQPSVRSFDTEMPLPPEDAVSFNHLKFDAQIGAFPSATKENLERGKIYFTYYCIFCHGADGKGNGEVGKSYTPKPRELKNLAGIAEFEELYKKSFTGTGHSPVLERVVPYNQRPYVLGFIKEKFK